MDHPQAVPSRAARVDLRSGLQTSIGLVASLLTGYGHLDVCRGWVQDEKAEGLKEISVASK